ncbi:MAG: SPFH domain-containing protein [Anaerolineales bacterium]
MRVFRPVSRATRYLEANRRWQQFTYYLLHFIEGDHSWGQVRLIVAFVVIVLFVAGSRLFERIPTLPAFDAFIQEAHLDVLLPGPLLALAEFFASFFTRQTLRHIAPPLAGFLLALYFGAAYLRDLLELPHLSLAGKFLTATLFGGTYPHMTIAEGAASVDDPRTNPMLKIGGPGWVDIRVGNAALFERVAGPSAVLGAGTHFIRRFETVREAFDLREIERVKNEIQVITKDGVPLVLNEMCVRFRIRAREVRTEANPYPVMAGAVKQAVYNRRVSDKGLESWADMVAGAAVGTITSWIGRKRMDELIPLPKNPDQPDTTPSYRQALHDLLNSKGTRQRFNEMGAEIVWVSVGHLRPDPNVDPDLGPDGDPTGRDKIQAQLIGAWKSRHEALARDELADAEGYAQWLEDTIRAQAQADMIKQLTASLREARDSGQPIADVVTATLIEYLSGVSSHSTEYEQLQAAVLLQRVQKLLEAPPESGSPPNLLP